MKTKPGYWTWTCPQCGEVYSEKIGEVYTPPGDAAYCGKCAPKPPGAPGAEWKTHGTWISVEERLPEEETSVLIFPPGHTPMVADLGKYRGNLVWWESDGASMLGMDRVTHWMPLPEPPEQCEDAADLQAAKDAKAEAEEHGTTPWEKVKEDLDLDESGPP